MKKKGKVLRKKVSHSVEVDVSGQLSDTKNTVFAFSNGESYAIVVSGKAKRVVLRAHRASMNRPKDFSLQFYLAGLKILFFSSKKNLTSVVLDREIVGHETKIKAALSSYFDSLEIRTIGRKSAAHHLAYGIYTGKKKPNKIVKEKEIILMMGLEDKK